MEAKGEIYQRSAMNIIMYEEFGELGLNPHVNTCHSLVFSCRSLVPRRSDRRPAKQCHPQSPKYLD